MFLMIDNYDSFVYNLVRYFEELGEQVEVLRNDAITPEQAGTRGYKGLIISPGPGIPGQAGYSLELIRYFKGKIPILGICLGHQAIGEAFGGVVARGKEPVHGKISDIMHDGNGLFSGVSNPLKVTRYHSLVLQKNGLPQCLEITSETRDGVIMGIRHRDYAVEGVQFHPEAELTQDGYVMLKNFIDQCNHYHSGYKTQSNARQVHGGTDGN